jgi:hypothetical protein
VLKDSDGQIVAAYQIVERLSAVKVPSLVEETGRASQEAQDGREAREAHHPQPRPRRPPRANGGRSRRHWNSEAY